MKWMQELENIIHQQSRRLELAEKYIHECPCDPDITKEQWEAYKKWQKCVKEQEGNENDI
jgi:hypothetical protein